MKKIRLILIEDNRLLREGIYAMLKKEPDINLVAAFGDGESDLGSNKISGLKPDIVLLDLGLPSQNSLELVKSLIVESPATKVIVMDLIPIQEDILRFVEAGVSGFILKDATVAEFLKTIRSVAGGEKVLPSNLTESLFSQIIDSGVKEMSHPKLIQSVKMTKREREIVSLIAEGLANKEIAFKLNLSIYTVKSHVHNILEKMALNTRVQIAIHSYSNEETSPDKQKS
ncbi:MAG TPA: response regulator transcription factor [Ignavibacteria bacterium]|nr:response regulator transcription factor [Ignavibacteria bacterium]